ncbi:FecCD family ABC transporter permease [Clostridium senegalense]
MKKFKINIYIIYTALILFLVFSIIVAINVGSVDVSSSELFKIIINKTSGNDVFDKTWSSSVENIIWQLRLPRTLLAGIVGAGLALSGVLMQALTKNVLADPYILGISSGASTGAVISILLGSSLAIPFMSIHIGAFIGALFSSILVFVLSSKKGKFSSSSLVLTGVAVASVFSAITNFIIFKAEDVRKLYSVMFWMTGSLAGSKWDDVPLAFLVLIISSIISLVIHKTLDAMLLGEDAAITLGVNIKLFKKIIIVTSTLLTGIMVSLSGIIGFVGLIIPHICRTIAGSVHKKLIPLTVLLGSLFLIWSDILGRMIGSTEELPIGVVTAIIGAPFFLWLLRKSKYSFGG